MHEATYILTSLIPKNGEFEAYFKDINSGEIRKERRELYSRKNYGNVPMILQYFIENNTYPLSVYDSKFNQIGRMSFDSFQEAISKRCVALDIETLNPNRIPIPKLDEIVSISYGNDEFVVGMFNDKERIKAGKNYIIIFCDEKKLLQETLKDFASSQNLFLCGHNIFGFDFRYIKERAELLGIPNQIKNFTAKTLFDNRKITIIPNFINIDLLPILQYANLPSTKLDYVAKIFGLESNKMPIEELWFYYNQKQFDRIIEHNINDVKTTYSILKKVLPAIYLLSEKTIGTFEYGLYSNLPKNIMIRNLLNYYKGKNWRIGWILEIIDRELNKISFSLDRKKIKEKLDVKVDTRLEKAKMLDMGLMLGEKLKNYNLVFEELLKIYKEIEPKSIEEVLSRRIISGINYKLVLSMRKRNEYRKKIESMSKEIKENVGKNSKIYCSSGRYIVVDNSQDNYSSSLANVILHSKPPKIFLANCEGILIGTIPKKPVGMPEKFFEAFVQDLFDMVLEKPAKEMQTMKEKLDKGNLLLDDLKLEVRGIDTTQLSKDSKKKIFADEVMKKEMEPWERIYVVKLKNGFSTLEEMRKNPEKIDETDLDFYRKNFSELWDVYEKLRRTISQNSLNAFFE